MSDFWRGFAEPWRPLYRWMVLYMAAFEQTVAGRVRRSTWDECVRVGLVPEKGEGE